MKLPRRRFLHLTAAAAVAPALSTPLSALGQRAPKVDRIPAATRSERSEMADLARAFMQRYDVPGLSIAVGHAGALVYEGAFGWADREQNEALSPMHLFRIASVSKPITSVTIFSLIEKGLFRLTDRVFGPGGITETDYGRPPYHPNVERITVEHLLTHTSGGWSNTQNDPMFMNLEMKHAELIEWTLRNRPLDHSPGENYAYSNFGYCALGRVIEKITRQPYAAYVRDSILRRCGISDMTIGGTTLAERGPGEVKYYGQNENPYGNTNIARLDSVGGWVARPADLLQFLTHVDGFATPPDILKQQTIRTMVTASTANAGYAKGWLVNRFDNWWHSGSMPGTMTFAVRTHSGFCWAIFANTRRRNPPIDNDLDKLVWDMLGRVKSWRV